VHSKVFLNNKNNNNKKSGGGFLPLLMKVFSLGFCKNSFALGLYTL